MPHPSLTPLPSPAPALLIDSRRIRLAEDRPRQRLDEEGLDALAHSIDQHGLLAPVLVRDLGNGQYELLAGERRLKAHERLGQRGIPAILAAGAIAGPAAGTALELSLVENTQRENLDALELCDALTRLQAQGWAREALARLIGRGRSVVGDLLGLSALPEAVKAEYPAVRRSVPRSLLVEIVRARDPALQAELWEEAKAGALTVRAARQRRRAAASGARAEAPLSLPKALAVVRRCAGQLDRLALDPAAGPTPLAEEDRAALRRLRERIDALLSGTDDPAAGAAASPQRATEPADGR